MNKTIKTMAIAALASVTICGTTMATPTPRGGKAPTTARQHQKAPAPKPAQKRGHEVAKHHAPPPVHHPAPRPCTPPPPPRHHEVGHVEHHHEANGLAVLGAAVIGGIVGALAH